MEIKRIIPNINSDKFKESINFYEDFLGLKKVMDMDWIVTFASHSNPLAQISIVQSKEIDLQNSKITLSIEVTEIDALYEKAKKMLYPIIYEITNEPWGVRRFFVKDPNGVTINIMSHILI